MSHFFKFFFILSPLCPSPTPATCHPLPQHLRLSPAVPSPPFPAVPLLASPSPTAVRRAKTFSLFSLLLSFSTHISAPPPRPSENSKTRLFYSYPYPSEFANTQLSEGNKIVLGQSPPKKHPIFNPTINHHKNNPHPTTHQIKPPPQKCRIFAYDFDSLAHQPGHNIQPSSASVNGIACTPRQAHPRPTPLCPTNQNQRKQT